MIHSPIFVTRALNTSDGARMHKWPVTKKDKKILDETKLT